MVGRGVLVCQAGAAQPGTAVRRSSQRPLYSLSQLGHISVRLRAADSLDTVSVDRMKFLIRRVLDNLSSVRQSCSRMNSGASQQCVNSVLRKWFDGPIFLVIDSKIVQ